MVQGVYWKKKFLVRFQDGFERYLTSNQLTSVTVDNIPVTNEAEVPRIDEKPYETVPS